MGRPKKIVTSDSKPAVKRPRKSDAEKIKELERKLELLKNKPDKATVKAAVKIVKAMTKAELEKFIADAGK